MDLKPFLLRQKFWLKDFLEGSHIRKPYKEIAYLSEHPACDGHRLREQKLQCLLSHAKNNCIFYADIKSDNLSDFPVMNKLKYLEQYDFIRVAETNIPGQNGKVHIQTTSGSTGTPFAIPQDTRKRQRRVAELKYFGSVVGFKSHDKLIHLRTWNKWQQKTAKQIRAENIIPFNIAKMGESQLAQLCHLIREEKAVCLRGYASSFDLLAEYVKVHPMDFPYLKIIIAGSEALHEDVRAKVKRHLQCEIISQYANEECGILAQESIPTIEGDNVMYLNHADYYFEILKMDSDNTAEYGELGRIVITDMHNYAFPIIRYDTGDAGVLLPPNQQSNGYPVLGKLYGRRLDICYTTDNQPFSPMAIGRILKHFNQIVQWQFIQKGAINYTLKIILKDINIDKKYTQSVVAELKEIVGENAVIDIEQVETIPVLASGKRKPVVNEWKKT